MAIKMHTLDNRDQQRNLLKAAALLALATELILDNAVYDASTIMSDLQNVAEFVNDQIDDRLLMMNSELNPFYEALHNHDQVLNGATAANANVTVVLGLIRGTPFEKEEG